MSNFLLKAPECVLIHIPKTGGSTIRGGLWGGRYEGPVFGSVPDTWNKFFKFAFVRHPLDRLISAWADFIQLRDLVLTIDEFVDVVIDERISYDRSATTADASIRHHTIPQTHPFNTLQAANFVGKFENYRVDLQKVLDKVGMQSANTPNLRQTKHGLWPELLYGHTLHKAVAYYDEDFSRLGYARPSCRC